MAIYSNNYLFTKLQTMKKLVFVFLCMSIGVVVMAQTDPATGTKAKEKTMTNLRSDVRSQHASKKVVGHDMAHARVGQAVRDHRQVADTRRVTKADGHIAKAQGIKHPVAKAKRQVRVQDDNKKDHI